MKHNLLPRGFKSRAEKQSIEIRKRLGLSAFEACPARWLAELFGVSVTGNASLIELAQTSLREEFPNQEIVKGRLQQVYNPDFNFSALVAIIRGFKMILYNDQHSLVRQESDIMHEMAHVLCEHPGDDLHLNADIALRGHDDQYEQEASWLGGALQVPDTGLIWHARRGRTMEQIAEHYKASIEMVNYRWLMCGISRRLGYIRPTSTTLR